ncbi:MAG: hypothetical protein ACLVES_07945 [Faecalibacterium prausnitzii]
MLDGKKRRRSKIVYEAFSTDSEKTAAILSRLSRRRWRNIMPSLECKTAVLALCCQGPPGGQPRSPRDSGPALADCLQPRPW